MKIAITGGAGFIGRHLTKAYLDAGHDVLVIDNLCYGGSQQEIDPRARFYQVDIRDPEFDTILQHERPAVVSHHVSQRGFLLQRQQPISDADIHIRGLLHVLASCINATVQRFLFASCGTGLYGPGEHILVDEDAPLRPSGANEITKLTGEWYVRHYTRHYGLKHVIFRYANIYGEAHPADHYYQLHPINYFITQLSQDIAPVIRGSGETLHDHLYIHDAVQANLLALKQGTNQTLHISSGSGATLNQIYQIIAHLLGSTVAPTYLSGSGIETTPLVLDNRRARHLLGWQPEVSLQEGIRRVICWYQSKKRGKNNLALHDRRDNHILTGV